MVTARSKVSIDDAEALLAAIRGSVIVHVQDGVLPAQLRPALDSARMLNGLVQPIDDDNVRTSVEALEAWLAMLTAESEPISHTRTRRLLDQISEVDVALIAHRGAANGSSMDVGNFVDESFEILRTKGSANLQPDDRYAKQSDHFAIDTETLEVFGDEADSLLDSIQQHLAVLSSTPADRDAFWNIKKSAHTFKGAAGIVGLRKLSELAHRVEDLLARISEKNLNPSAEQIALLHDAADCLRLLSSGDKAADIESRLTALHRQFDEAIDLVAGQEGQSIASYPDLAARGDRSNEQASNTVKRTGSVVRISLDKLDELFRHVHELIASQSAFKARFHDLEQQLDETHNNTLRLKAAGEKIDKVSERLAFRSSDNGELEFREGAYELAETSHDATVIGVELDNVKTDLRNLYQNECGLIHEIQTRLMRLRNVEFGTIANRLQRTVRVTCDEEGKNAEVVIENGSLEIDTQVIDALIEPLLHLLKNAVVHGIEPAETRRMLGKPEVGKITVRVSNKGPNIVLSVTDDGRGIAFRPLLEKAVASNLIGRAEAEEMTTGKIHELIFLPGLTTAPNISLNAGRGVGMSIVRESVAAAGGIVSIETWPQKGTTFSIRIPRPFAELDTVPNDNANQPIQLPAKKSTVLIVDDSPSVRLMTSKVVEKAGWFAETARDGVEALEKLRVIKRPAVILSDIEMPRMGGYEFVEALNKDGSLKDIPVIVISSRTNERQWAEAAGVMECLTKPFDETQLVGLIGKVASEAELVAG